jgi:hypothetical protein
VRLEGDRLAFELMDQRGLLRLYEGRVTGNRLEGRTVTSNGSIGSFTADRAGPVLPLDPGRE